MFTLQMELKVPIIVFFSPFDIDFITFQAKNFNYVLHM